MFYYAIMKEPPLLPWKADKEGGEAHADRFLDFVAGKPGGNPNCPPCAQMVGVAASSL